MSPGKIMVAQRDGIYLLKLSGDIRVTLCASISDYMEQIFAGNRAAEVYVDLIDAECIDSTTLGLLAKLAIYTRDHFGIRTRLLCVNRDILRTFESMDIAGLFDILGLPEKPDLRPVDVTPETVDEREIRRRVLEAHQLLVKLNPDLMDEFYDLITSLESQE